MAGDAPKLQRFLAADDKGAQNMKRTRVRSVYVGLAVLLLVALLPLTPSVGTRAQTAELAVAITADGFDPAEETVAVGTQVTWTNTDTEPHILISLDGDFDPFEFGPGGTLSLTLSVAGTYSFQLDDENGPTGTIEVTGAVRDLDAEASPDSDDASTQVPELPEVPLTEAGEPQNLTPVETARLAHIHAGTCDELGIVVYSFANARSYRLEPTSDDRGPVELLVGSAGVEMPDLFIEPFSIHVHESDLNKQNYIACADIGGQPDAPWTEADGLVFELVEQQDSGLAGFASLRQGPDGTTDVSIFLSGDVRTEEAVATPPPATNPPTTYVSPTYGYEINYNDTWDVSQEISSNGRDTLILTNGVSYIAFNGAPDTFGGDVADCVSALLQERTSDPNAFNVEVARGPDGEPLVGGTQATGAFAVFNHDYRFSSGVVPYTLYVNCVPLVPGESVLGVVQNAPAAEFESQIAPREALFRGVVLDQ